MTRINFQNVKYLKYVGKGAFPRASFARDLRFLAKNALPDTASYFKDVGGNLLVSILKQKKVIEQNSIGPLSTLQFNQILVQPTAGLLSAIADEFNRSNERPKEVFLAVSNKNKGKAPKLVIDHLESETAKKVQLKADKGNTFQKEQEKLFNETISETIKKMSLSQNGLAAEEIDEKALEALIDNKLVIPVAYFDAYGLSVRYFTKLQCDTELKDSLATFIEGEAWPCLAAKGIDLDKHPPVDPGKSSNRR